MNLDGYLSRLQAQVMGSALSLPATIVRTGHVNLDLSFPAGINAVAVVLEPGREGWYAQSFIPSYGYWITGQMKVLMIIVFRDNPYLWAEVVVPYPRAAVVVAQPGDDLYSYDPHLGAPVVNAGFSPGFVIEYMDGSGCHVLAVPPAPGQSERIEALFRAEARCQPEPPLVEKARLILTQPVACAGPAEVWGGLNPFEVVPALEHAGVIPTPHFR